MDSLRTLIACGVGLRILVFGGRDYTDFAVICRGLNWFAATYAKPALVIHGNARGTDKLAGAWARHHHITVRTFDPDYDKYGPGFAPLARNQEMIDGGKPHCGIGFPGGSGTADMARRLNEAGLPIFMGATKRANKRGWEQ